VPVVPINDTTVEVNESVIMTIAAGDYLPGTPSTATVTIVSDDTPPDLTISSLTVPAESGPGLAISVNDTTRNQGTVGATASTTAFYLSVNSTVDSTDTLLDSRPVPALAAGASDLATTSLTIPASTAAGVYRIIAKADGPGQLVETSESNNTRAVSIKIGPDLTVSALSVPANIAPAVPFTATYTVTNSGGSSGGESTTRFYLSSDLKLDETDRSLGSQLTLALDPDQSRPGTISLTVPADTVGGVHYVIAVADGNQQVAESAETNNTRFASTRVGPDLRVATLSVPVRASVGSTFSVTESTKNFGPAGAGSSRTAFYLSANALLDASDTPLNVWRPVEPLDPNETSLASSTITLPAIATAGTWYIIANADDLNQVDEAYETNNTKAAAVGVGPDLGVSAATSPSTVTAGTSITVTDTIKNSGLDTAATSRTRFYLSLNTLLDGGDTPFAVDREVLPLAPNATNMGSTTLAIPSGLSGRYYLLIVADGYAAVAESSETNNIRVISLTINP
jgi:subtilase family serine protease